MEGSSLILTDNISRTCRICFDTNNPKDFISPCLCDGGSAYIHRKCLDEWRAVNKMGRAFKYCEVCQFEYVIEPIIDDPVADKRRLLIFRLLVTRDVTLILLLFQAIIIGLTFLLQWADKKNHVIKDIYPTSMSSFGIYYLSSLIIFFAILGLFGLIGLCCGWVARNDPCYCGCYQCYFFGAGCHNCNGNSNCNDSGSGGGSIILIIIIILAVIGLAIGIILGGILLSKIIKRHTNKLWLRQETKKYVVKDFQGKRHELKNISTRQSSTGLSIRNPMADNNTNITPSAPVKEAETRF
ncbi:unnamed protein product [Rotaria sp. Silwood1]|nr:unnamed protein product [Rotaria sp. Silwood1]CAF3849518.1 unnamed protein product [Rotaria sp. Silwood1]CAF4878188.1 unnamed protein product [Rotaria sp. Silwood1]CAF4965008.1 unnamed protein product [Rotaria sp. Silwood1]